ncbi:MAG TPA: hypothetical protein VGK48_20605 [Terriglobia bacterium]|jgi:hypothetical protein
MADVWQPNKAQWRVIWIVATVLILSWPADRGRSLATKVANWLADPADSLPALPAQLPIGLDDNGDAVAAHDAEEATYYRAYTNSRMTQLRMKLKTASDPFDPSTERQILAGIGILGALAVWRLNGL